MEKLVSFNFFSFELNKKKKDFSESDRIHSLWLPYKENPCVHLCAFLLQVGIIGGSGLDDPEFLDDRREIYRETPYGMCNE